jgi:hypothetical protein
MPPTRQLGGRTFVILGGGFVTVAIPLLVMAVAREEIGVTRSRAEGLNEVVELDGFL